VRFLLDTNVLSEVRRVEPDRRVLDWLDRLDEDCAFISVVCLAEIRRGLSLLEDGRRRDALARWLGHDLLERFAGRILTIDAKAAFAWGDLMANAKRRGISLSSMDGLIAATALVHDLTLATRNTKDFQHSDVLLFDPWAP
jgi:toxin FitB